MKGVRQMPHLADCTLRQEHLDDIEADFHRGILQQPQIVECRAGKALPSFLIHGLCGPGPVFGGTGFYFHENEAILISKNQVQFAAFRSKIGSKKS